MNSVCDVCMCVYKILPESPSKHGVVSTRTHCDDELQEALAVEDNVLNPEFGRAYTGLSRKRLPPNLGIIIIVTIQMAMAMLQCWCVPPNFHIFQITQFR